MNDAQPSRIADRYVVQKELGSGSVGVVYLAIDERLDRRVAVKLLHPDREDADNEQRFIVEARAAAKLDHPSLCGVYDFGRYQDRLFLVLAYIDGVSLAKKIHSDRELPIEWCVRVISQIAEGIAVAHAARIVHCDLKPENVLIRHEDRRAVVMDFGLAGLGSAGKGMPSSSSEGFFGSPAYMSPEQARREWNRVGPASDVYSLGVTMFEMFTRKLPLDGTFDEVVAKLRDPQLEAPKLSDIRPSLPEYLSDLCAAMLAKDIAKRPTDMRQIAQRLKEWNTAASSSPPIVQPPELNASAGGPPRLVQTPTPPPIMAEVKTRSSTRDSGGRFVLAYSLVAAILVATVISGWVVLRLTRSGNASSVANDSAAGTYAPVSAESSGQGGLGLKMPPTGHGRAAIDWHLQRVDAAGQGRSIWDVNFLADVSGLSSWVVYPPAQERDWRLADGSVQASFETTSPSVLYSPLPVSEFELTFERQRKSDHSLQLVWLDQPGLSCTASAGLRLGNLHQSLARWTCYQTGRIQSLTAYENQNQGWEQVKIRCTGQTVIVEFPDRPAARFSRTGSGKIAGYVGFRQTSETTELRNFRFIDKTPNRAELDHQFPTAVFLDESMDYFGKPTIDFLGNRLAVLQQFGGDLTSIARPLRRGAIWDGVSGRLVLPIDSDEETLHFVGPGVLCQTSNRQTVDLFASRRFERRDLQRETGLLGPPRRFRESKAHWHADWDPHHRWLIQRSYPSEGQTEYHLIGVAADTSMYELCRTGTLPLMSKTADFAAGSKQWVLGSQKTWLLLSAKGEVLARTEMPSDVQCIAINADGNNIVVATADERLTHYQVESDQSLTESLVVSISDAKEQLRYSPDGKWLVARIANSDLNLVLRARDLAIHRVITQTVGIGVFTPDSRSLITPHRSDAALKVWRIDHPVSSGQLWRRDESLNAGDREKLTHRKLP